MTEHHLPHTAIIVVAAGSGTRLGAGVPKALVDLAGRTVLGHALDGIFAAQPMQVVVVAPEAHKDLMIAELTRANQARQWPALVVTGGVTRQQSVAAGLAALDDNIGVVLVHDAARALTPAAQIDAVAAAVTADAGVIPALAVVDTLKRVEGDAVVAAVDRSVLAAAQTPQGFERHALEAAYSRALAAGEEHTDDAALFAAAGGMVRRIAGDEHAFKITTPADLERARLLLQPSGVAALPRVGVGTDVHAFGGEGNLWLAGLEWPGEQTLSGHSDGDAVAHAIVDALLTAAGQGDIGQHFGTDHPEYAGAHADVFLARTAELVAEAGFAIGNVAVQFQANRPRFSARRAEAEAALSQALGGAPVSVSATTTDGLGFTGRAEGVAVTAVAMLFPLR